MSKKILWIVIVILLACNIGLGIYFLSDRTSTPNISVSCDANRFKSEYEALNGKDNGRGGTHLTISLPADNKFTYTDSTRVKQMLSNGTGVIYFGFPECPWCRNILPTLADVSNEYDMEVLYLNNKAERDIKKLVDGEIITEQNGTTDYFDILELLGDYASVYGGLEDDSIKRIYFPTVVFVKDGEIVGLHEGTVNSQEDASVYLDAAQQKELKSILREYFEILKPQRCSNKEPSC